MANKVIRHYGTKRHSGRYPWGSGGHGKQHTTDFLGMVDNLRKQGMSETDIAASMGMKTTEFRELKTIEVNRQRAENITRALELKDKGLSNVAIGQKMGVPESTVRSWLDPKMKGRADRTRTSAEMLMDTVDKKGPMDIGAGVEVNAGLSRTKFNAAVRYAVEHEGYQVMYVNTTQLGTGKPTSIKVLAPPGMEYKEVYAKRSDIATLTDYTNDGGRTVLGLKPPQHLSDKRVLVRFAEDGGADKDGVIELRRDVPDLDLGNSRYAQVRIAVGEDRYMKGMAIYSDNIPDGYDVVYNVSKKRSQTSRKEAFKEMKKLDNGEIDLDNPFGSTIQRDGQRGALNIVDEEGAWSSWSKNLSSQVLSKQSNALAKKQLTLAKQLKQEELDEIMSIENPVVREHLLRSFADSADSAAVDLKAAALPRQASHVILPITSLKENEVYAPMYKDGEPVVLIRHPHGGIFEIPEVKVNNRNPEAKDVLGNAKDAIGIHPKTAQKLSGADFDGDTVIVIPNHRKDITTAPSLQALKDFDPRESYPKYDGMKLMTKEQKQMEMGKISNLITDMTIMGADQNEIARAVKHSMVVIDAEKHKLNYKASELDNDIASLKEKYQGGRNAGASTIVSRASSQERVLDRVEGKTVITESGKKRRIYIDPETGDKVYTQTGKETVDKKGNVIPKKQLSTKMAEAKSAFELSSGTKMETLYAEYADDLKNMARKARLASLEVGDFKTNPSARKTYAKEVERLKAALKEVDRNRPKERQAQLAANEVYRAKLKANKNLDKGEKKRLRGQALIEARARLGAKKPVIKLTDREWTAIEMGAISKSMLRRIISNSDPDTVKERALPRTKYKMTDAKIQRAKTMAAAGYTPAEIAGALGVSATTIRDAVDS